MISKVTHSCSDEVYYVFKHGEFTYILEEKANALDGVTVESAWSEQAKSGYYQDKWVVTRKEVIDAFWKEMENG